MSLSLLLFHGDPPGMPMPPALGVGAASGWVPREAPGSAWGSSAMGALALMFLGCSQHLSGLRGCGLSVGVGFAGQQGREVHLGLEAAGVGGQELRWGCPGTYGGPMLRSSSLGVVDLGLNMQRSHCHTSLRPRMLLVPTAAFPKDSASLAKTKKKQKKTKGANFSFGKGAGAACHGAGQDGGQEMEMSLLCSPGRCLEALFWECLCGALISMQIIQGSERETTGKPFYLLRRSKLFLQHSVQSSAQMQTAGNTDRYVKCRQTE